MKTLKMLLVFCLMTVFMVSVSMAAAAEADISTAPKTNNGKKWRIAYYEGGEYIDYQKIFTETIKGLMKLGWIEQAYIPQQKGEQTKELWNWLTTKAKSNYLQFIKDGHYSANWDDKLREKTAATVIKRLNQKNEVDLMIAMGTWAGKDLANNSHSTPTEVVSASDPVAAGIIKSVEDSGFDHVHAQTDPFRYERQVRVFHEIIGFNKMGICYEDTKAGRSYASIDKVEMVAKEKGFEIVRAFTKSDVADTKLAEASVKKAFQELAKKSDAIYVTVQGGVNYNSIPSLVHIANTNQIPTFSQSGSEEVKYGFLASISQAGFKYIGEYHAEITAKILNGASPRELTQLFEEPPKIAINLKTAEAIGFDPPVDILLAADEIFQEINTPPAD
ncbi:ABC transporter substrate-binding protein [Thermodesulfobacteriota bacterium]